MLRRHLPLFMLSLFAAFALSAPRAEAANIILLDAGDNIFCEDGSGVGTMCTKTINLSDANLTNAGSNINLELDVTLSASSDWDVSVTAFDGANEDTQPFGTISADGKYYVPFSAFEDMGTQVDFTSINQLTLIFTNPTPAAMDRIDVVSFAAVPEPGTAGMLMLGLFGLAAASPRKRIAA